MEHKKYFSSATVIRANNNLKARGLSHDLNSAATKRSIAAKTPDQIRDAFRRASQRTL